ncbi:type II toxin-antitoxin system RelE/ParE family toxin [Streptomyces sp. NPDC058247]|uniref:type II toxin-antitoxin system RelE family toxin n=1 Tax=Streptomyces sp. NPDC058247 TaxID=3346401 RepID=UPI0036E96684
MPAVNLSRNARRSLAALRRGDRRQVERVHTVLRTLRAGRPIPGARRLTGDRAGQSRVMIGKLRLIYEPAGESVRVLTIAYRRNAYGGGSGHSN